MQTLIVSGKKKDDLNLLKDIAERMGMNVKILTEEEAEDIVMVEEMKKVNKNDTSSMDEVYKELDQ